jgi:hypothetical protein
VEADARYEWVARLLGGVAWKVIAIDAGLGRRSREKAATEVLRMAGYFRLFSRQRPALLVVMALGGQPAASAEAFGIDGRRCTRAPARQCIGRHEKEIIGEAIHLISVESRSKRQPFRQGSVGRQPE